MVGYHKRCDPAAEYAKTVIDSWRGTGDMGGLRYVRITMPAGDWQASGFTGLIRTDEKVPPLEGELAPGGMSEPVLEEYVSFVNYYIHQVNLMRHLLGEPYRVTCAERSGVLLAVESRSGVAGVIEMTPYRTTLDWEESALVAFEKGYVMLRLPAPLAVNRPGSVEVLRDPGGGATPERVTPTLPWIGAMRRQAERFVEVCRGEASPPCDAEEAAEDLGAAREYVRLRFGE
jgi:predicted dehydrogenase